MPGEYLKQRVVVDPYPGADIFESDDEAPVNRVGKVDMNLYAGEQHVGYDASGATVEKVFDESAIGNLLRSADPEAWRNIIDTVSQKSIRLTDAELEIIYRIREGKLGVKTLNDEDFRVEFEWEDSQQPLITRKARKAHFQPSRSEEKKIRKIIAAIRAGAVYRVVPKTKPSLLEDLWGSCIFSAVDSRGGEYSPVLAAPKLAPPTHAESYNPPPEFLFDDEEQQAWHDAHDLDKQHNFCPTSYSSLRHVPAYENSYKERFLRCLDLYICPRMIDQRANIRSDDLLPDVPSLDNFRPFPTRVGLTLRFGDGTDSVRTIAICERTGILVYGCSDGTMGIHNISAAPFTYPELYVKSVTQNVHYAVTSIKLHAHLPILVFTRGNYLYLTLIRRSHTSFNKLQELVQQYWGSNQEIRDVDHDLQEYIEALDLLRANHDGVTAVFHHTSGEMPEFSSEPTTVGEWREFRSRVFFDSYQPSDYFDNDKEMEIQEDTEDQGHSELRSKDWNESCRLVELLCTHNQFIVAGYAVLLHDTASSVDVHSRGLYVVTSSPATSRHRTQCLLHHIRQKKSLSPIKQSSRSERIISVQFHASKPLLFVGYTRRLVSYDLLNSSKVHKFSSHKEVCATTVQESYAVRTTMDGSLEWYDFEYANTPYRIIKIDNVPLTSVAKHPRRDLIAVGTFRVDVANGCDGKGGYVQLLHAKPSEFGAPEITPLNRLKTSSAITALAWCGRNHWLISGQEDGSIKLWV